MKKDGSFIVLFKDDDRNKVFLVKRSDMPLWVLTGGEIEKKETPEEAGIREAIEETGFKIKLIRKVGLYNIIDGKDELLRKSYLFEGRVITGNFKPEYPGCLGRWFSVKKLPKEITKATIEKIQDARNQPLNATFVKNRSDSVFRTISSS